jgi:ribonuclease HII
MSLKSSVKALKADLAAFDAAFGVPVCGIDEVGRGPLAGPVVTACVYIPPEKMKHPVWASVNDSKKLTPQKRDYLFEIIKDQCVYAIAEASAEEIDALNIHHATLLAMKRAYHSLCRHPDRSEAERRDLRSLDFARDDKGGHITLIDGKFAPALPCTTRTIVKGDATSLSIAAASILAKVTRDRMMTALHAEFPHYGWDTNVGYGTAAHMDGIARHGITAHHRRSFAPCK